MAKGWVFEYIWEIIALWAITFLVIKFVMIKAYGLIAEFPTIFFFSLKNVDKYAMQEVNQDGKRRYLNLSNTFNILFYTLGVLLILTYIFFTYVV